MAHYARIVDGIVAEVIVADDDFVDNINDTYIGDYLKTSFNTIEGEHLHGGTPLRKNFAGIGYSYDHIRDAFIPPKPLGCEKFILDEDKCTWKAPIDPPDDGEYYKWNDATVNWELMSEDDGWMG